MTYYMELRRSEEKGREAGKAEGKAEGKMELLTGLVRDGLLSLKVAAQRAGVSEETFRKMAAL